jgi:hypothetical protein
MISKMFTAALAFLAVSNANTFDSSMLAGLCRTKVSAFSATACNVHADCASADCSNVSQFEPSFGHAAVCANDNGAKKCYCCVPTGDEGRR